MTALLEEATRRWREGDSAAAEELIDRVLAEDPANANAIFLRGVMAYERGDAAAARYFEHSVAAAPQHVSAHLNLGIVYREFGRLDEAERCFRRALNFAPELPAAHFSLGNLLLARGAAEEAIAAFEAVLAADPGHTAARNNLALALRASGRTDAAAAEYEKMLTLDRNNVDALINLAALRNEQGRYAEAAEHAARALDLVPDAHEAANNLAVALLAEGQTERAEEVLSAAVARTDGVPELHENLGNALRRRGAVEEAEAAYRRAYRLRPTDGLRMRLATLLPVVPDSLEALERWRARFAAELDVLAADPPTLSDPNREVGATAFHLAYHDANNLPLHRKLAEIYRSAAPDLRFVAPHCEKPGPRGKRLRVGFLSRFFRTHAVGWAFQELICRMPRDRIEVVLLSFPQRPDPLYRRMATAADEEVVLPVDLAAARRRIAELALDVLAFAEIGMDPLTYFLAFARLAPVQCALLGHGESAGIETIDYFISSEALEPPDAEAHYCERLIRLPGLPYCYSRPELPDPPRSRDAFGLPEERRIYFCAQTLAKVHPAMDAMFRGILEGDPDGLLLFPSGFNPRLAERLRARFKRTLADVSDRVVFLPTLPSHVDFNNILMLADVILDTRPYGSGNTAWQALAAGTPVVTWPSDYMRGRFVQALYRVLGIDACTVSSAEDYVATALRVGTDDAVRAEIAAQIAAGAEALFLDRKVVDAFAHFLVEASERR